MNTRIIHLFGTLIFSGVIIGIPCTAQAIANEVQSKPVMQLETYAKKDKDSKNQDSNKKDRVTLKPIDCKDDTCKNDHEKKDKDTK